MHRTRQTRKKMMMMIVVDPVKKIGNQLSYKEPAIDITDITRNLKVARKEPVKLGPTAWPKMTNILTWRGEVVQIVTAAAADGDISTWKEWIGKAMVEKPNMDAQRSSGGYRAQ